MKPAVGLRIALLVAGPALGAPGGADAAVSLQGQVVVSPIEEQCRQQSLERLASLARLARVRAGLDSALRVLPGGAATVVKLSVPPAVNRVYCGRVRLHDQPVEVFPMGGATGDPTGVTRLRLALPAGTRWQSTELILVGMPVDSLGRLRLDSAAVGMVQDVRLSSSWLSGLAAVAVVALAYLSMAFAVGRAASNGPWPRKGWLDPVQLTAGTFGKASLSQLQILGFTLLVLGLLVFILLRTFVLSDISPDVLLLLGISAGGAAGSKLAGILKDRISFESWSWLRNREWLTAYEAGVKQQSEAPEARWADLLRTAGGFDVYSFQLVTVSALVALALITSDLSQLAKFDLPDNLLSLLGLSNVVFIGGKAVAPNAVRELDDKVKALRVAEGDWLAATAAAVIAQQSPAAKLQAAKTGAPDKYQTYIAAAREAARMLKSIHGEGTRFKTEQIRDEDLLPALPG